VRSCRRALPAQRPPQAVSPANWLLGFTLGGFPRSCAPSAAVCRPAATSPNAVFCRSFVFGAEGCVTVIFVAAVHRRAPSRCYGRATRSSPSTRTVSLRARGQRRTIRRPDRACRVRLRLRGVRALARPVGSSPDFPPLGPLAADWPPQAVRARVARVERAICAKGSVRPCPWGARLRNDSGLGCGAG
jgi:hypothetical protein